MRMEADQLKLIEDFLGDGSRVFVVDRNEGNCDMKYLRIDQVQENSDILVATRILDIYEPLRFTVQNILHSLYQRKMQNLLSKFKDTI